MRKQTSTLTALSMFLCFTACFTMTAFAKVTEPVTGRASGSDASKPPHNKVNDEEIVPEDIASPSDIMGSGDELHLSWDLFQDDSATFGFSIRKTGTRGDIKDEATFRLYHTYDDAVSGQNPIYFMSEDPWDTYTACSDTCCDSSRSGKDIYAGRVDVEGLPEDTYYLAEVTAPEGYEKIPYILEIVLKDDGTVYYRQMPHGTDLTEADDGLLTIVNNTVMAMPGTGGSSRSMLYAVSIILILTGMGFLKIKTGPGSEE